MIIGGDKRQIYLKNILADKGCSAFHIAYPADISELYNIGEYSDIILPIPVSKDGFTIYSNSGLDLTFDTLYGEIKTYQRVYGGGIKHDCSGFAVDFTEDKTFKLVNAYYTAQGTLRLLLENTEGYIIGRKPLIIGFGDVARTLARMLSNLGLSVTVAMRNTNQMVLADTLGYEVIHLSEIVDYLGRYDYIFGTVPANILTEKCIAAIKNESVYFELASAPFTAEKSHFEKYGKKYVFGGGLPGRFLPFASAELIADFVLKEST